MIVEYEPTSGRILHIIADPVPVGYADFLTNEGGHTFLNIPPVELPPAPLFAPDGTPILNEDGSQMIDSPGSQFAQVDIETDYVEGGEVLERPLVVAQVSKNAIAADDIDEAAITNLPVPCVVKIDGVEHTITDGELIFATTMPGTYKINIDHFPYMPWSTEIVAS